MASGKSKIEIDTATMSAAQRRMDKEMEYDIDDPWAIIDPPELPTDKRIIQLPPPHSPGQREMIEWPGSGVVLGGRRWGKCLPGWQRVYMADGTLKMVEDIVVGDLVLSFNLETRQMEDKSVVAVMNNGRKAIVEVKTGHHDLLCTLNHPFLSEDGWIEAGDLTINSQVYTVMDNDWRTPVLVPIRSLISCYDTQTWDITVADNHNFIAEGFIVHNTEASVQRLLRAQSMRPGMYWWVGLSWKSASMKRAWRLLNDLCTQAIKASGEQPRKMINRSNFEIRLPNGSEIWMRTAERPESLAGEGIMGAVVDEFTLMPELIWTEYLEGTLLDYGGWVMFTGVPKGRNWGSYLYEKAKSRDGWKTWHFTTYDNPFINPKAIDEVRDNTPERIFNQEYLALVIDDAGSVFRGVMAAATAIPQERAIEGHVYVCGIDWARVNDFTCFTIIDTTTYELVYMDRFNQIDYSFQVMRFKQTWERFHPIVTIAERNSIGDPIITTLRDQGYPITPFDTTLASKDAIIKGLSLGLEQQTLKILNDDILIGELQSYEMKQTGSGAWKYSAPSNAHDDTVMSLAMAWSAVNTYMPPVLVVPQSILGKSKWRGNGQL